MHVQPCRTVELEQKGQCSLGMVWRNLFLQIGEVHDASFGGSDPASACPCASFLLQREHCIPVP